MKKLLLTLVAILGLAAMDTAEAQSVRFYEDGKEFNVSLQTGNFTYSYGSGDRISYNYNNQVSRVGSTYISYNYNNQVSKIGGVYISYNYDDKVSKVGGMYISYDYNGRVSRTSGRVN